MPGMTTHLQTKNAVVVSAFHSALVHQFLLIALAVVALWVVWNALRSARYRRTVAGGGSGAAATGPVPLAEPPARRVLRVGFGLLWVLDGLLQLQAGMPLGLSTGVLQPSADSSPTWVQHVVGFGVTLWSDHPVQAAAAAVWIQLGIGVLLIFAPRGRWSRFSGVASVGWGLVVWVFGEAFGGIFGQGASWLMGVPGAVLLYCAAGVLVALPERAWSGPRVGRIVLRSMGGFFVGMAVLQAWPGRGYWQGASPGRPAGTLTAMVGQMAQTSQPGLLAAVVRWFGRVDAAHGWAVNAVVVVLLAAVGVALWSTSARVLRPALLLTVALCVADWVFVQDFGFFGGVGTDPNSMLPTALLVVSGYVGATRGVPATTPGPEAVPAMASTSGSAATPAVPDGPWWARADLGYLTRMLVAVGAVVVVLVGAVPMAGAAADPTADPILAEAVDGTPNIVNAPTPGFVLEDQSGNRVTLSGLAGRTVVLTFLDPVCTSDCPYIAQEMRQANTLLGADSGRVVFVAVVANPVYRATTFTNAFDRQEGLDHMGNWLFLTGSLGALQKVWDDYGVLVQTAPAGGMVTHGELAYIVDAHGRTREVLSTEPGTGSASYSSFSAYLADAIEHVIHT